MVRTRLSDHCWAKKAENNGRSFRLQLFELLSLCHYTSSPLPNFVSWSFSFHNDIDKMQYHYSAFLKQDLRYEGHVAPFCGNGWICVVWTSKGSGVGDPFCSATCRRWAAGPPPVRLLMWCNWPEATRKGMRFNGRRARQNQDLARSTIEFQVNNKYSFKGSMGYTNWGSIKIDQNSSSNIQATKQNLTWSNQVKNYLIFRCLSRFKKGRVGEI